MRTCLNHANMSLIPQDGLEGLECRARPNVGSPVDFPVHGASKLAWGGVGLPLSNSRQNGLDRITFVAGSCFPGTRFPSLLTSIVFSLRTQSHDSQSSTTARLELYQR